MSIFDLSGFKRLNQAILNRALNTAISARPAEAVAALLLDDDRAVMARYMRLDAADVSMVYMLKMLFGVVSFLPWSLAQGNVHATLGRLAHADAPRGEKNGKIRKSCVNSASRFDFEFIANAGQLHGTAAVVHTLHPEICANGLTSRSPLALNGMRAAEATFQRTLAFPVKHVNAEATFAGQAVQFTASTILDLGSVKIGGARASAKRPRTTRIWISKTACSIEVWQMEPYR